MKFYDVTFFCDSDKPPKCRVRVDAEELADGKKWPITVYIFSDNYDRSGILIHTDMAGLEAFKDSVTEAVEKALGEEKPKIYETQEG